MSSDPPRFAFLQAPESDRVVRQGTGADDMVSSVIRALQGSPWRAGGSRAAKRDRSQDEGRGAPAGMVGERLPRRQLGWFRRGTVESPSLRERGG